MLRRSAVRQLLAGGAGLFLHAHGRAEETREFTLRSNALLVLLEVSVTDRDGQFVSGLERRDFRVLEDGKEQRISVFDAQDHPVDIGILVDQSRSMIPKRADVLAAAQAFIEASNAQDEVFIVHFNDRVVKGLPSGVAFSSDPRQLKTALGRFVPAGRTALNDAVLAGLEHLQLGRESRKALVLLSDGGDTASEHTRRETLERAQKGFATIYAIGLSDEQDQDRNPGFLRRLAETTGGSAYFPLTTQQLVPLCRRIAQEIRARYALGYVPQSSGRAELRKIAVQASAPGRGPLKTQTRSHYRYDEAE